MYTPVMIHHPISSVECKACSHVILTSKHYVFKISSLLTFLSWDTIFQERIMVQKDFFFPNRSLRTQELLITQAAWLYGWNQWLVSWHEIWQRFTIPKQVMTFLCITILKWKQGQFKKSEVYGGMKNTCKTDDMPISISCTLRFVLVWKF